MKPSKRRPSWALVLALALGSAPASAQPPEPPVSAPTSEPPAPALVPPSPAPQGAPDAPAQLSRDQALDLILPCGLRVRIARDATLPVAAVILAIESGAEDDPPELPGLVHALAFHALQGNYILRPGEGVETVHGGGGVATMAVGLGQIRYESVIPVSRLAEILTIESLRLRASRTTPGAWKTSLAWATSDPPRASLLRPEAIAAVHRQPALAHNDRAVTDPLRALNEGAVAALMRAKLDYTRAALIVVAPLAPQEVLALIYPLFADLPPAPHRAPPRAVAAVPTPRAAPELAEVGQSRAPLLAWPIPASPAASLEAQAICRALNRQRRVDPEDRRIKVTCAIDPDPRRGVMLVQAAGVEDPVAALALRLERLRGADAALLNAQRVAAADERRFERRTPLGLARHLAAAAPGGPTAPPIATLDALTGILDPQQPAAFPQGLEIGEALVLVRPSAPGSAPNKDPAPAQPAGGKPIPGAAP